MKSPATFSIRLLLRALIPSALAIVAISTASFATGLTFTSLHSFANSTTDGASPRGNVIQASDGNFYGTTDGGGASLEGTVFRMSPSGVVTILFSFPGVGNSAGTGPVASLLQAKDGNFYGTTANGGQFSNNGTIFKMTPTGTLTTLHSFNGTDGSRPLAALVQASDGNLYGTTELGGTSSAGTVFKITPAGSFTSIYSFNYNGPEGGNPYGKLIQAKDGNLYGTTNDGGGVNQYGVVFKLTLAGILTVVHGFTGRFSEGYGPRAGVIQTADGNFHGTTYSGGSHGQGTVFQMTAAGALSTVWSFNGASDGASPEDDLLLASDGNFYGTTSTGVPSGLGTVFELTSGGTFTTLHAFSGTDGANPFASLIQGTNGNLYGTTNSGGPSYDGTFNLGRGTVFEITLPPAASLAPTQVTAIGATTRITLNWLASTNATTYNIYRGVASGQESATPIATGVTTTTYANTGLTNGTRYYYKVAAVNGTGISPDSAEVSATPHNPNDFTGDGHTDLLFQDSTTNAITVWDMNAYTQTGSTTLATIPASAWHVVGEGDFNGDGKPDLVLQNSSTRQILVYLMNGTTVMKGVALSVPSAAGLTVVGVGDFNGDGQPDLALQAASDGQVQIWIMNSVTRVSATNIPTILPTGWTVCGAGDFNGDGKADLLFQYAKTGQLAVWYMNGNLRAGSSAPPTPATGLRAVAIGDFNSDGQADIVFQNQTTRALTIWFMNGVKLAVQRPVAAVPGAKLAVVAPR